MRRGNPLTSARVVGTIDIDTMAIVTTARIIEATATLRDRTMAVMVGRRTMAAVTVDHTMAVAMVMAVRAYPLDSAAAAVGNIQRARSNAGFFLFAGTQPGPYRCSA